MQYVFKTLHSKHVCDQSSMHAIDLRLWHDFGMFASGMGGAWAGVAEKFLTMSS
jgi:hypothetical protein